VVTEEARKFGVKPVSIANLNREFVRIRELCKEWNETVEKFVTVPKGRPPEEGELENNGAELRAKEIHRFQKFCEFGVASGQGFFVSNCLWHLDREGKTLGSSRRPVANCLERRASVEGRVHLDCREMFGVETQVLCGSHPFGIERSRPAGGGK